MIAPRFLLRVNFSHEDKAAKGLRSFGEPVTVPAPPVYFTAREMVDMYPRLLLLGERGSGKTCFARELAEETDGFYVAVVGPDSLHFDPPGGSLVILDGIDRLGAGGDAKLRGFLQSQPERPMLVLGDAAVVRCWSLPPGFAVHTLRPLSLAERQSYLQDQGIKSKAPLSPAAANPALFSLSLTVERSVETAEDLIDAWIEGQPGLAEQGFQAVAEGTSSNRAVDDLLSARHLGTLDPAAMASLFLAAPDVWTPSLASLMGRNPDLAEGLARLFMASAGDAALRGVLLVATRLTAHSRAQPAVANRLLEIIEGGVLSAFDRDQAARFLALWGDPRDLEALCTVPGGRFTMGSDTNPNSRPVHNLDVGTFRIGRYPVTNGLYSRFVQATGRSSSSPDAGVAERANAPATDLTWHDARAYCDWLTGAWRAAGHLLPDERVRLPSEPEWERAARGDQPDGGTEIVYPWGLGWNPAAANSEATGFNAPCAVGLFPAGVSPYGCFDMAGQVWEWTTTLWGDDMARPSFSYPYRNDGREDIGAEPAVRRVLRGGCFSSTSAKACCTYRGSLEPAGFWRGNGFRIVVAREGGGMAS